MVDTLLIKCTLYSFSELTFRIRGFRETVGTGCTISSFLNSGLLPSKSLNWHICPVVQLCTIVPGGKTNFLSLPCNDSGISYFTRRLRVGSPLEAEHESDSSP